MSIPYLHLQPINIVSDIFHWWHFPLSVCRWNFNAPVLLFICCLDYMRLRLVQRTRPQDRSTSTCKYKHVN